MTTPDVLVDERDGIDRLADGRLDAMILPTPTALAEAAADPSLAVAGQLRTGELYAGVLTNQFPARAHNLARARQAIFLRFRCQITIDESGIAILPPVLREHVPENETVQATTHRLVSTIDIPCDDEPRKMCGPLLASSPNGCGPGGHGMSNYSYPAQ